jgi:ATP-dependent helicase HrpB
MAQDTRVGPSTRLEVVTEGILTRMLQNDPGLEGVGLVLFDEFHERSLNADLGLALTLDVRRHLRPELRLGLLSATLDVDAVRNVIEDAEAVHAPGRVFPVSTEHRPLAEGEDLAAGVARAVAEGWEKVTGGILVFLPGWGEIRRVGDRLTEEARLRGETVLVLHGSLAAGDQAAVLEPLSEGRKTVLSTSVAETSVTIPDIDLVIDSGLARFNRFDQSRGLDRLVTERVSRASADQRRGRAGRTKPGLCWRLWPAAERLEPQSEPEILRADLSGAVLEASVWGARDSDALLWMTAPPVGAWTRARGLLTELGVLDDHGTVTAEGKALASLGTGPRLGVLLRRTRREDLGLAAACAALLQDRDPLPTLADPDVRLRLEPLLAGESAAPWFRLRETALDLGRRIDPALKSLRTESQWTTRAGRILAPAFPDRIARRSEGSASSAVFQLQAGRMLRVRGPLAFQPWLVVVEADAGEGTGWVSLAAPLSEAEALEALAPRIKATVVVEWDLWRPKVFRCRQAGTLLLERTGLNVSAAPQDVSRALAFRLESLDPETLPWTASSRQLIHRLSFLDHSRPADWSWLRDYADLSGGAVFTEAGLHRALEDGLPWALRSRLDQEAPESLVVPSGSRRKLNYQEDGRVVLEVRIQEIFGLAESPRIGGRPVVLHLLSPAQRPLQVTADLSSFWKTAYPEVRKEMRGRYPRHYWPENPLEAEPTARAKPRGT